MDIRGTVAVQLRGPAEQIDQALHTIQQAGVAPLKSPDRGPDIIEVHFPPGTARPSDDYLNECVRRAVEAAAGTGFSFEVVGTIEGNTATQKHAYNARTGEQLGLLIDTDHPLWLRESFLEEAAKRAGIGVNDIELRDPPEFQIPEA